MDFAIFIEYPWICSAQFVNLCNFKIVPRKLQISKLHNYIVTVQSTAQFVNYLPMEQVITPFANGARERLSSALEHRYGPKKLRRLTLVRARPDS